MITETPGITGEEYTVRMLEKNQIEGLLPLSVRKMDGKIYLYYEITSKQPLTHLYETRTMKSAAMESLLYGISQVLERMRPYLLDGQALIFAPEYVFSDMNTGKIWLCYMPGNEGGEERGQEGFRRLAEFLLKRLDHGDRRAVDLGYELFARVSADNFSLGEVLKGAAAFSTEPEGRSMKEKEAGRTEGDFKKEEGRVLPERQEKKEKKEKKGPGRQEKRGRKEPGQNRKPGEKKKKAASLALCGLAVAAGTGIFMGIVYLADLDLTQTGGLAFFCLAVIWGIYRAAAGRKDREKKIWPEDEEEEDEDAFMEAVLAEIYAGKEEPAASKPAVFPDREPEGETRCLTEPAFRARLRLVSQEPEKYPDLEVEGSTALLGKKRDQVDLWVGMEAVSRVHARLERTEECGFVTDLNSMNGTFVNGERLHPNEKRRLCSGDRVSFANLHYRVKIREF